MHPRITEVQVRKSYVVELTFTDGSTGEVDLDPDVLYEAAHRG